MRNHEQTVGWLGIQIVAFFSVLSLTGGLAYAGNPIGLEWDHNAESDLAGYYVYEATAPGGYGITYALSVPAGTNSVTFPLPHADGTFYWVLRAYDLTGNLSGPSNEVTATFDSPLAASDPVRKPVLASSLMPGGRPSALKVTGFSPVAVRRWRNGLPGRAPKTRGPVRRGCGPGLGVRMTASSFSGMATTGAAPLKVMRAFAQSA